MHNEGKFGTEMREVLQSVRDTKGVLEGLDWGNLLSFLVLL